MRISDCSSDVCSSDLHADTRALGVPVTLIAPVPLDDSHLLDEFTSRAPSLDDWLRRRARANQDSGASRTFVLCDDARIIAYYSLASSSRSEEHTSELQSLMRISYAVFCLKKKNK